MLNKDSVIEILESEKYYNMDDLRFNSKLGYLMSKNEYSKFIEIKKELIMKNEKNGHDFTLFSIFPLKSFNSKFIYFTNGRYLFHAFREYYSLQIDDYIENKNSILERNMNDILLSRVFSEVEGTLRIENVSTTHKRIKEIFEKKPLKDKNDIIVHNMIDAINYITGEKPEFNKANLLKLYKILSCNCLDEEDMLKPGAYYRDDRVNVGDFDGAPHEKIDELMDSLFDFVNNEYYIKNYKDALPFICHYYIIYVHPYFDYNGRTARMVSFWINLLYGDYSAPLFLSEAINENKNEYYKAIVNTRLNGNDLTYFIGYLVETAIKFSLIYKNIEYVNKKLSKTGDFLSDTETRYLKKIMIHNVDGYFNYKTFNEYINTEMSKQGALKTLNNLARYGVLEQTSNNKGVNIYKINPDFVKYKYNK